MEALIREDIVKLIKIRHSGEETSEEVKQAIDAEIRESGLRQSDYITDEEEESSSEYSSEESPIDVPRSEKAPLKTIREEITFEED